MAKYKINSNTPVNGSIKLTGRGFREKTVPVTFKNLEELTISSLTPSTGEAQVGEEISFIVSGTTNPIVATVDPVNSGFTVTPDRENPYKMIITSTRDGRGNVVISGDTVVTKRQPVSFQPADNISLDIQPGLLVTKDKEVTVIVTGTTKNITLTSSESYVTVTPKLPDDPSCKEFTVRTTQEGKTILTASGVGVNTVTQELVFRAFDPITVNVIGTHVRVGETMKIVVDGADSTRTLQVTSSVETIVPQVVDHRTINVTATAEGKATLTISGDHVETKTVEVEFFPAVDLPLVTMFPAKGIAKPGQDIRLVLSRTTVKDIEARSSSHLVSVKKVGDFEWLASSQSIIDSTITFSHPDITDVTADIRFELNHVDLPQFTVTQTEYSISETDLPLVINVENLEGELKAKISNPFIMSATVDGSQVTVNTLVPNGIKKDEKIQLVLSVEHQNDVVITLNIKDVEILVPTKMPCDGLVVKGFSDETIFFNAPTVDSDDVIIVEPISPLLKTQVKDINRVYLNTDLSCPPGVYKMKVKHTEFLDAEVTYHCEDRPKPIPQDPAKPHEWFDLGPTPDVTIRTTHDTFVDDVFNSPLLLNDKERLAYILGNKTGEFAGVLSMLCAYNQNVTIQGSVPTNKVGSRWSRIVYDQFLYVFGISDYYEFRSTMKVILRVMKHYRETSFKTILMMRFESDWNGTRDELAQYRNIAAFLNKYIDSNGQSVSLNGLDIKGDGYKNMERFCSENIQP